MLDIIVGAQWGDEGKGRMVDLLAAEADFVARFSGGDNAGHTVTVGQQTFKLHLIPSGIIHPQTIGLMGNGMVINPSVLLREMDMLREAGVVVSPERLRISHAAHLITPGHLALDVAQEAARGKASLGTTLRGIGPAYTHKVARHGLRAEALIEPETLADQVVAHIESVNRELDAIYGADPLDASAIASTFADYGKRLSPYIGDVSQILDEALAAGRRALAEGAQGTLLDLDHGTYPFVTSSSPTAAGALLGLGVGPRRAGLVIGVTKVFQTRVGAGPFPTEVSGDIATRLRGTGENPWDEFGTTTGRPRRVGWLDMVLLRYAVRVNGLNRLALTKLDILSGLDSLKICVAYRHDSQHLEELPMGPGGLEVFQPVYEELPGWQDDVREARRWPDLPREAQNYIRRIETLSGVRVVLVSVGPERSQVIDLRNA